MGMRKTVLLLPSMVLAVLLSLSVTDSAPQATAQESPPESSTTPNFVFILADDMTAYDLKYMPKTTQLLGARGMSFDEAFVSLAQCCPSRATVLRGQYAHNTGVWSNGNGGDPAGGWQAFRNNGNERDNLATTLRAAGYRTGLIGKYFNHYDGSVKPPGWDDWFATFKAGAIQASYFNYDANDNGTIRHYGSQASDYNTDVTSGQTLEFIDASVTSGKPFFAYVGASAPHAVARPAPRHVNTFNGEKAPRFPSFNEWAVNDKPPWVQQLPRLSTDQIAQIDARHENRVETLQALDELVEATVNKLSNVGALGNTYLFFTSDNGWHQGEHRIPKGKAYPYEEDIHMPLLVRGPGVQAGSTTDKMVLNTDYFPTFTDLAGVPTPDYVDGRSLRPILEGSAASWRSAVLLEQRKGSESDSALSGIRTSGGIKYVEYNGGFRELYNLTTDPYELTNSYYNSGRPPDALVARLQELKSCVGATCRAAEDGP
jgi:N-acetylglucosamine-6-sulfatase